MTDETAYPTTPPNEIETRKGQTYVFVDPGTTLSDLPRIHRTVKAHYHRFGFANCLQLGDGSKRTFGDGKPYTVPGDGKHYHWLELEEAGVIIYGSVDVQPIESKSSISDRIDAAYAMRAHQNEPETPDPDDLIPETEEEAEVLRASEELGKALVRVLRGKEGRGVSEQYEGENS